MKYAGRLALVIFGPVVTAILLAGLAFLLHANGWIRIAIYIGEIIGVLLIMHWFRLHKKTSLDFGLRITSSWSSAIWTVLYVVIRVAAWLLLIPQTRIETNWRILIAQAAFFLLLNAMGEELHFRGLLFGTLREMKLRQSLLIAAIVSSGLFALAHLIDLSADGWQWFFLFICDGLALCAIRIQTRSVFWAVLVHGLLNICTGVLFVGPETADDSTVLTYIAAIVIIDLLFFAFIVNQAGQKTEPVEQMHANTPQQIVSQESSMSVE